MVRDRRISQLGVTVKGGFTSDSSKGLAVEGDGESADMTAQTCQPPFGDQCALTFFEKAFVDFALQRLAGSKRSNGKPSSSTTTTPSKTLHY